MFATRDQENLTHTHHTTAAAKPLNQGVRALQPKTPGNFKTPFRASRNDENKPFPFQGQKTVLKDGPSKLDKNAFVTPAAPRNRAPLGAKTTNAKAQPFKTPGPTQQNVKKDKSANKPSTARRSGRSKITVAPTGPVQTNVQENDISEDEPDCGYAPPAVPDLPDFPPGVEDAFFPRSTPEDMYGSYGEIFHDSPTYKDRTAIRLQKEAEEYKQFQVQREKDLMEQIEKDRTTKRADPNEEVEAMLAAGPRTSNPSRTLESKPDTFKAKSAILALSSPNPRIPSVATKQTASSRAKHISPNPLNPITSRPLHNRLTAPRPHSKNTIGFPAAKKPLSIIPSGQQLKNERAKTPAIRVKQDDIDPKDFVELYGEPPFESEMWYRLKREERLNRQLKDHTVKEEDDLAEEFFKTGFLSKSGGGEDEDEVFQLPMPED